MGLDWIGLYIYVKNKLMKDNNKVMNKLNNINVIVMERIYVCIYVHMQIALVDPGNYRQINELLQSESKGKGQLEIMNLREKEEGDEKF